MKKSAIFGIVLGIIGALLAFIGGIVKYAYTNGSSYVVTYAEAQAIIKKAQASLLIGIVLIIIAVIIFIIQRKQNDD